MFQGTPVALLKDGDWQIPYHNTPPIIGKIVTVKIPKEADMARWNRYWLQTDKNRALLQVLIEKKSNTDISDDERRAYEEQTIALLKDVEQHERRRPYIPSKGFKTISGRVTHVLNETFIIEPAHDSDRNTMRKQGYIGYEKQ